MWLPVRGCVIETLEASIVITTRGRCEDLRRAIKSCLAQTGVRLEVLVYDDMSSDGTQEMVETEFPQVRYKRGAERTGYIVLRNRGFRDAKSPLVFSIDDDAWFSSSEIVKDVVRRFSDSPTVAAFAIHFNEPDRTESQGFMPNIEDGALVRSYIGCAHAIRVAQALEVGGYREYLVHQGEERDLCLRLINRDYEVRYLHTAPIIHEPSATRDHTRLAYLGLRNTLLFDLINVPFPYVLIRLPADAALLLKHKITLAELPARAINLARAIGSCLISLHRRQPVTADAYRRYRSLPNHGASRAEGAAS